MKKVIMGIVTIGLIIFSTGCQKKIIGKWKAMDKDNEYYYIFNDDKTCSYEMTVAKLNCTYEDDGSKLTILYDGNDKPNTFEYRFDKKTLIIIDETGKENKFMKEK